MTRLLADSTDAASMATDTLTETVAPPPIADLSAPPEVAPPSSVPAIPSQPEQAKVLATPAPIEQPPVAEPPVTAKTKPITPYNTILAETTASPNGELPGLVRSDIPNEGVKTLSLTEFNARNPGILDTLHASFMENNAAYQGGSYAIHGKTRPENTLDDKFNVWDEVKGTKYETLYETHFRGLRNKDIFNHYKAEYDQKEMHAATLAASGNVGIAAGFATGVLDPLLIAPSVAALKVGNGVLMAAKGLQAAKVANSAQLATKGLTAVEQVGLGMFSDTVGTSVQELALHALDPQRTNEESVANIALGTLMGGALGAGWSMTKHFRPETQVKIKQAAEDLVTEGVPTLDPNGNVVPFRPRELPNGEVAPSMVGREGELYGTEGFAYENSGAGMASAGAALNPEITQPLGRMDLAPSGPDWVTWGIENSHIANMTPNARAAYLSESTSHQRTMQGLAQSFIRREAAGTGNEQFKAAIETLTAIDLGHARKVEADTLDIFAAYEKAGGKLTIDEYSQAEFLAIKGAPAGNDFIQKSADLKREFFLGWAQRMVDIGRLQLKEGETLLSKFGDYYPALMDASKVVKQEPLFLEMATKDYTPKIVREYYTAAAQHRREVKQQYDAAKQADEAFDNSAGTLAKAQKAMEKDFAQSEEGSGFAQAKKDLAQAQRDLARLEAANATEKATPAKQAAHDAAYLKAVRRETDARFAMEEATNIREAALFRMQEEGYVQKFIRDKVGGARLIRDAELDEAAQAATEQFIKDFGFHPSKHTAKEIRQLAEEEAKLLAKQTVDKVTGRARQGEATSLMDATIKARGSMKARTLNLSDQTVMQFGRVHLTDSIKFYTSTVAPDVNLTKEFGDPRMLKQIAEVKADYDDLRELVGQSTSVDQLKALLRHPPSSREVASGKSGVGKEIDVEAYRERVLKYVHDMQKRDVADLEGVRDRIRGTYLIEENGTMGAGVIRAAKLFQNSTKMNGSVLSNITEAYRPVVAYGLKETANVKIHMLRNTDIKGISLADLNEYGVGIQASSLALANDVPLASLFAQDGVATALLRRASDLTFKYSGLNWLTNHNQRTVAFLVQNKIARHLLGDAPIPMQVVKDMESLGLTPDLRQRIAQQFREHSESVDNFYAANTGRWTDAGAQAAYRAAILKEVDAFVVRPTAGNMPLMVSKPMVGLILQFRSYNIASTEAIMVQGLQRDHKQYLMQLAALSTIGAQVSMLKAANRGAEQFEKWKKEQIANPFELIANGLDQSGYLALAFDFANTGENITGVNLLKDPVRSIGSAMGYKPDPSLTAKKRQYNSGSTALALMGPTMGQIFNLPSTAAVGQRLLEGDDVSNQQRQAFQMNFPFLGHPVSQGLLNALNGNTTGFHTPE